MEDQTVDMQFDDSCQGNFNCESMDSPKCKISEEVCEETIGLLDEENVINGNQEISSQEEPTGINQEKIYNLSNSIQNLKNEHTVLSNEVKEMTGSFLSSEVLDAMQHLNTKVEVLQTKYLKEYSERKRLYNEVIELKGNIRVFCRCRPLNKDEAAEKSTSVVEFDSSQENELQIVSSDSSKKQFKFDHIFRPEDSQEAVFAQTKPIIASVLDGYNVCIFAYGQTGTGKTFTMEGTPDNRGVNYRTLEELFRISEERSDFMRFELFVSMLEVYNEKIKDLLVEENSNQPPKKLEIKQSAEGTQEVPGLVEARAYSTNDVWDLLKLGYRGRSVGATGANELSSRSHCLLRVTVKGENLINGQKTRSHLWLVDLAGSERVGKIDVEGERLKESTFINKSLSSLGDVIFALASKTSHIPYRNSKLTHILQSSLGGDCKTLMFVQISPSAADQGETLCSLNFASRVRGIESGPARKQTDLTELIKYKQIAEKQKHDEKETKKLQESLQSAQLRLMAREHVVRSLQEKVRDLENQLADERKTRLKQETRSFAASSSTQIFRKQSDNATIEKRPPLAPAPRRMPLRGISNFVPPPSSVPFKRVIPAYQNKENIQKQPMQSTNSKVLLQPHRRVSMAVRPSPSSTTTTTNLQPRRRVSIATLRAGESSSYVTTPLHSSTSQINNANGFNRQAFLREPRKPRYSKLFTPVRSTNSETTPAKFMGSPPNQGGGGSVWKPTHPKVVALQRKSVLWSPLKLRGMLKNRRSIALPVRDNNM